MLLYREIDRILDMQISFSLEQKHPLIPMLSREFSTISLDTYKSEKSSFIDLIISKSDKKQIQGIIGPYSPANLQGYQIVRIEAEELNSPTNAIDGMTQVDSAVLAGLYLKGEQIMAEYRFHSSEIDKVSAIVEMIGLARNKVRIVDLGPSKRGIDFFNEMDERIHLGMIQYRIRPDFLLREAQPQSYIEFNFPGIQEAGLRGVYYKSTPLHGSDRRELSFGVGYINSPFLMKALEKSIEARILTAAYIAQLEGDKFTGYLFLPISMVEELLSIYYGVAKDFPDTDFKVIGIKTYTRDLWEWI